jgi:hypothetical protein
MDRIVAIIKPGDSGASVVNLQDVLRLLISRGVIGIAKSGRTEPPSKTGSPSRPMTSCIDRRSNGSASIMAPRR